MSTQPKLSIVVPVRNEEACVEEFIRRTESALSGLAGLSGDYELIFIDDGSSDRT